MKRRRQAAILTASLALLLAGCSLSGGVEPQPLPSPTETSAVPAGLESFYEQTPRWVDCGAAECAKLEVPLDYADRGGATVELAMLRVPATGDRLGSLVVEPGGPGASAVEYARQADSIVGPAVREHFDVVGIDPRGVGLSQPLECLTDEQLDALAAADGTPESASDEAALLAFTALPAQACATGIGLHMDTVSVARDLDIARAVLGDATLAYLGKSYGTSIGARYAALFPERVGRMVLDGALPPALDRVEVTQGQAVGFERALEAFISDCLTHDDCPLEGDPASGGQQLRDWLASLDDASLSVDERAITEALASYAILTNLYVPDYDYPRLREALADAMVRDDATRLMELLDSRTSRGPDGRYLDNSTEAFYAVTCSDQPFEGTVDDVRRLSREWASQAPTFGPSLAWSLLTCRGWPAAPRPEIPAAAATQPILVVSTREDPATPFAWGPLLVKDLPGARLLTVEAAGHTAYRNGSDCTDDIVDAYLVQGTVPDEGRSCT